MNLMDQEMESARLKREREMTIQDWLEAFEFNIPMGRHGWMKKILRVDSPRLYWGRAAVDRSSHLFELENFQQALIKILETPGDPQSFLLKELSLDRNIKKPRGVSNPPALLAAAIEAGCGVELVKAILKTGYDPNTSCDREELESTPYLASTAIEAAVRVDREDILLTLVEHGATPTLESLLKAFGFDKSPQISAFLAEKIPVAIGNKPFTFGRRRLPLVVHASSHGHLESIRTLVDRGFNINAKTEEGDVISFLSSIGLRDGISGSDVRELVGMGAIISARAAVEIIKRGDAEAIHFLHENKKWPEPYRLVDELYQARSWDVAGRLLQAGAYKKLLREAKRQGQEKSVLAWFVDRMGAPPTGLLESIVSSLDREPRSPTEPPPLSQRVAWEKIASEDPAAAALHPWCPHPAMAWRVLLDAGDQPPSNMLGSKFFGTASARSKMDQALEKLAKEAPPNLNAEFISGGCQFNPKEPISMGKRLLCSQWSTDTVKRVFVQLGGKETHPTSGTWHSAVSSHGPIRAESGDAREERILFLKSIGWEPIQKDLEGARTQALRDTLTALREARNQKASTTATTAKSQKFAP